MVRRVAAVVLGLLALGASPASGQGLPSQLNAIIRPAGARAAVYVLDATSGTPLFASNGESRKAPASVEKVYTTSTALRRYGPTGTLDTTVVSAASIGADGTLSGDLVLKGAGDPTFGSRAFSQRIYGNDASVESLAEQLRSAGLKTVQGNVLGDESAWDSFRGVPDDGLGRVDPDVGPLSALSFDRDLTPGGGSYVLKPAAYAAGKLLAALKARGVAVSGSTGAGAAPPGARQLAKVSSPPMAALVALTNGPSDNYLAESLVKGLGARFGGGGSTAGGASVVKQTVAGDGAHPAVVDGSGLSRRDQTSPHDVVRVLTGLRNDDAGAPFRASLPVAGRSGTLRTRMRGTAAAGRCQAKTGTLSNVSSLAGYCQALDGHDIAFALLMNNVALGTAHAEQDQFAAALVRQG
ncbi:MAG TPA: D-alanyl-D-alanine carboxypeptidase/D-alanyl-D-alanine-endopeptidase [Solirubrobacteraceae bacterium]|jgi:D-alanyl-D-alanine carboxypeptidase/D-alanyl-D-alanine-endopeptidase (penicillin-binding protein 4)|nr:D-alanyl-D-alanine carboxypeptidase/D-alanyl-D-alanine-endopeptidase [Solirubrobacteraceae bacterium]